MALDFVAGCLGGCAGVIVGHPLDTVKVKLQTQDSRAPIYRGAWHCLRSILKNEAVAGLFKGVTSPLGGVALVNAIVFGAYGGIQRRLGDNSPMTHFWAGAGAGIMQSFITCPVELAKTRLQIQKDKKYKGSWNCLAQLKKSDGMRGVFKGLGITVLREAPAYGAYFYTYQVLAGDDDTPTWRMLMAGGLAGMVSWILVYPLDVVKTRYQADGVSGISRYTGSMDCLVKSVKSEGYSFLTRGLSPALVRSFPTNAVTFTVVTWILRLADFMPEKKDSPVHYHHYHNHHHRISWDPKSLHLFEDSAIHPL